MLQKRAGYRKVFHHFDPKKVAAMSDAELGNALKNSAIIRNRLKVYSARQNARVFVEIQKEFGSFDTYVWKFGSPLKLDINILVIFRALQKKVMPFQKISKSVV